MAAEPVAVPVLHRKKSTASAWTDVQPQAQGEVAAPASAAHVGDLPQTVLQFGAEWTGFLVHGLDLRLTFTVREIPL